MLDCQRKTIADQKCKIRLDGCERSVNRALQSMNIDLSSYPHDVLMLTASDNIMDRYNRICPLNESKYFYDKDEKVVYCPVHGTVKIFKSAKIEHSQAVTQKMVEKALKENPLALAINKVIQDQTNGQKDFAWLCGVDPTSGQFSKQKDMSVLFAPDKNESIVQIWLKEMLSTKRSHGRPGYYSY